MTNGEHPPSNGHSHFRSALKELVAKLEIAPMHAVDTVEGWSTDSPIADETSS